MNITFALPVISLLVAVTLSLIITRVGAVALRMTGLSDESARFQSRSAFLGVGFTTSESESITDHPVRRHVVMTLMLMGNVGLATVIATMLFFFLGIDEEARTGDWIEEILALCLGLAMLWTLANSKWVERQVNYSITYALRTFTKLDVRDYVSLLELSNGFTVTEVKVEPDDWVAGKSLIDLGLAREGVLVLGIHRQDGNYVGAPSGGSRIVVGDSLVMYGPAKRLEELDCRCCGNDGDQAHRMASEEYDEYLASLRREDVVPAQAEL